MATISQPGEENLSTLVSLSGHRNITLATIVMVLDNSTKSTMTTTYNHTGLPEKNTRSQQDPCWETYVGQVPDL